MCSNEMKKLAVAFAFALAFSFAQPALAQTTSQESRSTAGSGVPQQQLTKAELDALVAPIALYPDPLLSEVLMASAYPLEVVQAERWLQANKNLKGDKLKAAVDKQTWDESIKSLVATPDVLEMMSEKLDWTRKLGDAVVSQQPDMMDAIQRLRAKAQSNDKLKTSKEQKVTVSQVQGKQVIAIEPTQPDMVYVPYYDPSVVYGAWPYPDYPPYYWPPPGYIGAGLLATGLAFGAGYALGSWAGSYWNGNVNWSGGGNNITINPPGNRPGNRPGAGRPSHPISGPGNRWQPRVEHRQGAGNRGGRHPTREFRGSGGQQVLKPGAGQGGRGEHKANVGNLPSQRPSAKARPSHKAAAPRHKAAAAPRRPSGAHARANVGRGAIHRGGGGHRAAIGGRGGGHRAAVGGGGRGGGGGGRGGGGRGGGGRGGGGGRRSDIRLKHDIVLLGHLGNGLGFYRFRYNGGSKVYVGVMAQEVQAVRPQAVMRGEDGYLKVDYRKLGLEFESYDQWIRSGAEIPHGLEF